MQFPEHRDSIFALQYVYQGCQSRLYVRDVDRLLLVNNYWHSIFVCTPHAKDKKTQITKYLSNLSTTD